MKAFEDDPRRVALAQAFCESAWGDKRSLAHLSPHDAHPHWMDADVALRAIDSLSGMDKLHPAVVAVLCAALPYHLARSAGLETNEDKRHERAVDDAMRTVKLAFEKLGVKL